MEEIKTQTPTKVVAKPADLVINQFGELIEKGQLQFPANYAFASAVKYAALVISQNRDLSMCTQSSVVQAISDMALQGLDVAKKQGYFIKYGSELKFFRSYFGDVAAAMQSGLVKDIKATVVYEKDDFEVDIEDDEQVVKKHHTKFGNQDGQIIGAYAVAILPSGKKRYCIMTKKEIDKNWAKSTNKNNQVQQDFPQEMAKRTVIRRLVKLLFNSSNTADNFQSGVIDAFNRTTENEYIEPQSGEVKKSTAKIPVVAQEEIDLVNEAPETEEELPVEEESKE